MPNTIQSKLRELTHALALVTETPRLEAEILLTFILKKDRTELITQNKQQLTDKELHDLRQVMERRLQGEPIAYITQEKEFWSLHFHVTPDVLIPRPETEHLIEWILEKFKRDERIKIADLGTGSGVIAISLAKTRPHWKILATDFSPAALAVAQHNAQQCHAKNIEFSVGSWCEALIERDYDVIVSNPPYISVDDVHLQDLNYEPSMALIAGNDGLDAIRVIVAQAPQYLTANGWLVIEHGYDQMQAVCELMQQTGFIEVENSRDLAGQPRFTVGCWPGE